MMDQVNQKAIQNDILRTSSIEYESHLNHAHDHSANYNTRLGPPEYAKQSSRRIARPTNQSGSNLVPGQNGSNTATNLPRSS